MLERVRDTRRARHMDAVRRAVLGAAAVRAAAVR